MLGLLELLFVFGTFPFWLTFAILMIVIWALEENEGFGLATTFLVGTIAALLIANPTWWADIKTHPASLIVFVAVYVGIGVVYGIFRWKLFLVDLLGKVRESGTRTSYKQEYVTYRGRDVKIPPVVRDYKARLIGWMTYWPWSGFWFLIHDPVTRLYRYIYETLHNVLQTMSDRTFAEFQQSKKTDADADTKSSHS